MKKFGCFLLMILLALILVGCTESTPKHTHSYKEEITNPTCTEKGYTEYNYDLMDLHIYLDMYLHSYMYILYIL